MEFSQNDFEQKVRTIYKVEFSKEIEILIENHFEKIMNSSTYSGKSFIILSVPSEWQSTDETFVWVKTIKFLTNNNLEEIIFAILEMKGHSKPNFWLSFPTKEFDDVKHVSGHTFQFTDEIINAYDFKKYIVQPFELKT